MILTSVVFDCFTRVTFGKTDRRNCDSICALIPYMLSRAKMEYGKVERILWDEPNSTVRIRVPRNVRHASVTRNVHSETPQGSVIRPFRDTILLVGWGGEILPIPHPLMPAASLDSSPPDFKRWIRPLCLVPRTYKRPADHHERDRYTHTRGRVRAGPSLQLDTLSTRIALYTLRWRASPGVLTHAGSADYTLGAVAPLLACLRMPAVRSTAHILGPSGPLPHAKNEVDRTTRSGDMAKPIARTD